MSAWSRVLLDLLICAGLLVVMPLGLRLLAAPGLAGVRRLWVLAAAPAAVSVWLPRGWLAAALAAAYLPARSVPLAAWVPPGASRGRRRSQRLPRLSRRRSRGVRWWRSGPAIACSGSTSTCWR